MNSGISNCLSSYFDIVNKPHIYFSDKMCEVANQEYSCLHYLWIYPISIVSSVIGLALAPISCLVNLISSAIFFCFNSCCTRFRDAAKITLILGLSQVTEVAWMLFARMFYPSAYQEKSQSVTEFLAECLTN